MKVLKNKIIQTGKDYLNFIYSKALKFIPKAASSGFRAEFHNPDPLILSKAFGCKVIDVNGISYIDYHMAYGSAILGHNHTEVVNALENYIKKTEEPCNYAVIDGKKYKLTHMDVE